MEGTFYVQRLRDLFGITAMISDEEAQSGIHRIIYEELCRGIMRDESRAYYHDVIKQIKAEGADSVILGCTKITMLITQDDTGLPVFDTTALHAEAGVSWISG